MKNIFGSKTATEAEKWLRKVKRAGEIKRVQCVLFRCLGNNSETIGRLVGYQDSHVRLIWKQYRTEGWKRLLGEKRGQSRGKAHLSFEEEKSFLETFKNTAETGKLILCQSIHEAHNQIVGKVLNKTVTYRLLHRHGWRKVAPRPEHPKQNKADMKRFKEAIFPPGYDPYEDFLNTRKQETSSNVPG